MKINSKILILSFLWLISCAQFANAEEKASDPVKIAIVGDTDNYKAEVDLLVAELSNDDSLALLERERIDLILKEHKIDLSNISKNSLQLGQLLGADGVLILKELKVGGEKYLSTRLVAVKPATIIDVFVIPTGKKSEKFNWVETAQWHFRPLFRKLNVSKEEAIPLSLLSFRAQTDDPEALAVEKQLNVIFSHRLMKEKEIFVNERWNLGQVFFETELEKQYKKEFWTGSMVIEGTFELKDGKIEAQLILNGKDNANSEKIEFSMPKNKLPELAEKMTKVVIEKAGKKVSGTWDIKEEAEKYFKESQWAYNCGLYETAQQAADASWALGNKSLELMMLRIRAYGGKSMAKHAFRKGSTAYAISGDAVSKPEEFIDNFIYALQIYEQLCKENPAFHRKTGLDGPGLIRFASVILHSAYQKKLHLDEKYHSKLLLLSDMTWKCFLLSVSSKCQYMQKYYYYTLLINYIPFWHKNTGDMISNYQKYYVECPENGVNRESRFNYKYRPNDKIPWVINWNSESEISKDNAKWFEYISSLLASENLKYQIDGLILRKFNKAAAKSIPLASDYGHKLLWDNRDRISNSYKNSRLSMLFRLRLLYHREIDSSLNYCIKKEYFQKFIKYLFSGNTSPNWDFADDLFDGLNDDDKDTEWFISQIEIYRKKHPVDFNRQFDRLIEKLYKKAGKEIPVDLRKDYLIPQTEPILDFTKVINLKEILKPYSGNLESIYLYRIFLSAEKMILLAYVDKKQKNSDNKKDNEIYFMVILDRDSFEKELIVIPGKVLDQYNWRFVRSGSIWGYGGDYGIGIKAILFNGKEKEYLYFVQADGKIYYYNKNNGSWKLKTDLKKEIQVAALHKGKIYIGTGEAFTGTGRTTRRKLGGEILALDTDSLNINTIASYRRNPPLSPLDNIGNFIVESLSITKEGNLLACIQRGRESGAFLYNPDRKKWFTTIKFARLWGYERNGIYFRYNQGKKDFSWDTEIIFKSKDKDKIKFKNIFQKFHPGDLSSDGKYVFALSSVDKNHGIITKLNPKVNITKSVPFKRLDFRSPTRTIYNEKDIVFPDEDNTIEILSWKAVNDYFAKKLYTPDIYPNKIFKKDRNYQKTSFTDECTVSLKAHDEGVNLYYTIDGTTPTKESKLYTEPFSIDRTTTVKAVAVKKDFIPSDIRCITFIKKGKKSK